MDTRYGKPSMIGLILFAFLTSVLAEESTLTYSQQPRSEADKQILSLVKKALNGMMEPVEIFDGPGNIKGVVVKHPKRDDNQFPVWVIDNQHVLLGDITDAEGKAVSRLAYLELILSKAITQEALNNLNSIPLTEGTRTLYVFADPNCEFCNQLYQLIQKTGLQRFEQAGLQIEWVPVSILNATSNRKAIALLKGGADALAKNENHYKTGSGGGVKPLEPTLNLEHAMAVQRNTEALKRFDEGRGAVTPTMVWTDKHGKTRIHVGLPKDLDNVFSIQAKP